MRREPIGVGYVGLGAYVPETVRTNDHWGAEWLARHHSRLRTDVGGAVDKVIQEQKLDVDPEVVQFATPYHSDPFRGTKTRRVMAPGELPSDMEVAACTRALEHAGVAPEEIDCLIVYSSIPDRATPHNQGIISRRLGLPKRLLAFDMEAGCSTFLPATTLATRLVQSGEATTALVVVSAASSWVIDYDTPSSVLPGDGAVAAVVRRTDPGLGFIGQTTLWSGEQHSAILVAPKNDPWARWTDGDPEAGRLVIQTVDHASLHIAGAHAASLAREVCHQVLAENGYTVDDVDFFVTAQSTAWFPQALAAAVGIPDGKFLPTSYHFQKYGHLFTGSVPLNMYLSHQHRRLERGDLVMLYSPGIGFTQTATLTRWAVDAPVPELR